MPNLPISQLPLATSGQPESWMAIVNYDVDPSGITNKIYFSALTEQFSGSSGTSGTSGTDGSSGTSGTDGSSGTSGTSGTDGSSGTSGSSGSSGTSGTSAPIGPGPIAYGLFSQTGNSITVSATTTESSLIGNGVGNLSVPANGFQVGDSFSGRIVGQISSKNNITIRIRVKSDSVVLADTGLVTMPQTTNKHYTVDLNFTIRTLGAATVASIVSGIVFTYSKDASNTFEGSDFSIVNNSTFDTTIDNTLGVTVQWGTTDVENVIYSEYFVLSKVF
jgi:hypothetical protein